MRPIAFGWRAVAWTRASMRLQAMRRRTVVWTLVVLALALPLLALAGGWWFLRSGRLERSIERAFAERLPGQLRIGALHLSLGAAELEDVDIFEPGQAPMAHIAHASIVLSYHHLSPRLEGITLDGVHLRLDRRSWDLLNNLIDAEDRHPRPARRATSPSRPRATSTWAARRASRT